MLRPELTDEEIARFAGHEVVVAYGPTAEGWMVPVDIVSLEDLKSLKTTEDLKEIV